MNIIPSTSKMKMFLWGAAGFALTAIFITRITPGVANFIGLRPGGSLIPDASLITMPNVGSLFGQNGSGMSMSDKPANQFSLDSPQGRSNIVDAILA